MPDESQYIIRQMPSADSYKIYQASKFDMDLNPLHGYRLIGPGDPDSWICNCPARTSLCRHVLMLQAYLEKPPSYNVTDRGRYQALVKFTKLKTGDFEITYSRGPLIEGEGE